MMKNKQKPYNRPAILRVDLGDGRKKGKEVTQHAYKNDKNHTRGRKL
jgi:hypothetical protein